MILGIHKMLIFSEVILKYVQIALKTICAEKTTKSTKYLKDMNLK